jgi:4-amino-4-deoxy-L-arabinose transferase-like glycosyltransferase
MSMESRTARSTLWKVFIAALAIRWCYALLLFATMGEAGLKGVDSLSYVQVAQEFGGALQSHSVQGWDWLGPTPSLMPLFSGLLALSALFFGSMAPLAYVLAQAVFDSATCLLVFLIAQSIDRRYALPASIAAVVNPTQIVMSGLVYPDTVFIFFVALFILGSVRWMQSPSAGSAALIAMGLVCAALIRVLVVPWAVALIILLACIAMLRSRLTLRSMGHLMAIAIAVTLCVIAIIGRNVARYDTWALTSQGGIHLLTVVPWVKQANDGTPWAQSHQDLRARADQRFGSPTDDPFEQSRRYSEIANEEWRALGLWPTAKAWIYGAAINLISPAIILSPPIILIPRTGFYDTPGRSMIEKIMNFLFHSESAFYTWTLLIGAAGVVAIRAFQLLGGIRMVHEFWRKNRDIFPILILFALWTCFILAVNGPVASPKYRLPLEPILNILTGIGIATCLSWWKQRGSGSVTLTVKADR